MLERSAISGQYKLTLHKSVFTEVASTLDTITRTEAWPGESFVKMLQGKLKRLKAGEPVADTSLDQALTE